MKKYFLFLAYVAICLMVPEFHPFSRFPMYSSFPNYSYTFYVTGENDSLLPYQSNFKVQADELGHMYSEVCEEHQFKYGLGMETDSQLSIIGNELLGHIIEARKTNLKADSVSLHRKYYRFQNGRIAASDKCIAKRKVE